MAEKPTLTRSSIIKNHTFTFPIQPRLILEDLIKKSLLKPLERKVEDDNVSMGNSNTYCTYYQRRGHAINN